jgi:DNA-binding protein YbaB
VDYLDFTIFICRKNTSMLNNDLLTKLQDLKRQSDVSKERMEDVVITEESGGGLVRISMNGNRKLQSFQITGDTTVIEKEELEDLICVAINRVLEKVNDLNEKEVMSSAQSLLSGISL